MKKKERWVIAVVMAMVVLFSSCSVWEPDLGQDLLPPSDNVFLFYDTIFDIEASTVRGIPIMTSDIYFQGANTTLFMLGKVEDTITGISEASLLTQFNTSNTYYPALNTEIDSLVFTLYIDDYFGNETEQFTIRLYEATSRVYKDSIYFSNYEMDGAYNPDLLAEVTITPDEADTVAILIENQAFIEKFLEVQADTALFANDSLFKDYFNGFYMTAFSNAREGTMAKVGPSNLISRLSMKYANDSTEVDSTAERDFRWATFTINEFSSQKINIYEHDYTGSSVEKLLNNPDTEAPFSYVQGLAGVNTSLSFTKMDEWIEDGKVAISSAKLIFDIPPADLTGISLENQPGRLAVFAEADGETLSYLYDQKALKDNLNDDSQFGGYLQPISKGMFFDTTYTYQFNMGLHLQSMVDGGDLDNKFRVRLYDTNRNPEISTLWSNLYTNPKRIRLEVVYIKL